MKSVRVLSLLCAVSLSSFAVACSDNTATETPGEEQGGSGGDEDGGAGTAGQAGGSGGSAGHAGAAGTAGSAGGSGGGVGGAGVSTVGSDGGVGGSAGDAGSAGNAGTGGSAGAAGSAGASGNAGAGGGAGSGGSAGSAGSAGAAGTAGAGGSANVPAAPSGCTASATSPTTISVQWVDNSNNETSFHLTALGAATPIDKDLDPNATTASLTAVTPATTYSIQVTACNASGCSSPSNAVVTTPSQPTQVPIPPAPTDLQVYAISATSLALSWTDPASAAHGIDIESSDDGITFAPYYSEDGISYTQVEDQGLDPATLRYYRIRFYTAAGYSAFTAPVRGMTWANNALAAPSSLATQAMSPTVARLSIGDHSSNELGFLLSIAPASNGPWQEWAIVEASSLQQVRSTTRSVLVDVTALEANRQYCFRVRAGTVVNGQDTVSAYSTVSCVNTPSNASGTAGATTTRFQNNAAYPIISLVVDGQEHFQAPGAIPPGGYFELPLQAGSHSYSAWSGFWQDGGSPFNMYGYSSTFSQLTGQVGSVALNNPSISSLLTQLQPSGNGYWVASVWEGTVMHSQGFCFHSAGSWSRYRDGVATGQSGSTSLVSYPGSFMVTFQVDSGTNNQGTLDELGGNFFMRNGPADWPIAQYWYDGASCP